jgi:Protein of unknown function (DUF2786)
LCPDIGASPPRLSDPLGIMSVMSRRNREKRAAKQKTRARVNAGRVREPLWGGPEFAGPDRAQVQEILVASLVDRALCTCGAEVGRHARQVRTEFDVPRRELDAAADLAVARMVRGAWEAGWTPLDVMERARRHLEEPLREYLAEAIVVESRRYAPAMVHPRWRAAVAAIAAGADPGVVDGAGSPHVRLWADRNGFPHEAALVAVLESLGLLCSLPVLERLLPLPGESRHQVSAPAGEVDQKALARVRALLAKAESTQFPEEAEALSAKAQELMSRYSLHQAVLDHDKGRAPAVGGRRIWLDAPYADAKALLVQAVSTANRARTVWGSKLGFATVIGGDTDLDGVELLVTSLLVQANRAMLAAGRHTTRAGTSRTRSFRQSFLVSYATRIGERLDSASSTAVAEIEAELAPEATPDSRLLPVLAARSRATDELTDRLFPEMVRKGISVTNSAGWTAGRAAADQAQFDIRGAVAG